MLTSFFTRRTPTLEEIEAQRINRTRGISGMLKVAGIIVLVLVAFLSSMLLLTPLMELHSLEQEREQAQRQLLRARAVEAEAYNRFLWMSDPEYFEQMARDRANQAKAGEHIIRRPTAEERQKMEQEAQRKRQPRKRPRRD
ncbi:MAG: septum formation initiator family protein [Akkermansia sp.]|nr:septum formation initiator family protein [Akkermansia sp.]MEE1265968.1 septum formation initiator family protein [Akkermansia sp.]